MLGLSTAAVADAYAVGAAAIGIWAVLRFPTRGPQSLRSAAFLAAGACGLLLACGTLTHAAVSVGGPSFALIYVVLPILTFGFWSAAHVVRVAVERLAPYRG